MRRLGVAKAGKGNHVEDPRVIKITVSKIRCEKVKEDQL